MDIKKSKTYKYWKRLSGSIRSRLLPKVLITDVNTKLVSNKNPMINIKLKLFKRLIITAKTPFVSSSSCYQILSKDDCT